MFGKDKNSIGTQIKVVANSTLRCVNVAKSLGSEIDKYCLWSLSG